MYDGSAASGVPVGEQNSPHLHLQSFHLETLSKVRFVICVVLVIFSTNRNMKVGWEVVRLMQNKCLNMAITALFSFIISYHL